MSSPLHIPPPYRWTKVASVAMGTAIALLLLLEFLMWIEGLQPSVSDSPNLWARERAAASPTQPTRLVLVGASRMQYGLDLEVARRVFGGGQPIQLAIQGATPRTVLRDIAADPTYAATTIVGFTPSMYVYAPGPRKAAHYVQRSHAWSLSDRAEVELTLALEKRLAALTKTPELFWGPHWEALLPARPGVRRRLPCCMVDLNEFRQAKMSRTVRQNPTLQRVAGDRIVKLETPRQGLAPPSRESLLRWQTLHNATAQDAQRIRKRGGRVVFVRFPSSGRMAEAEASLYPRPLLWDRFVSTPGVSGIHFRDDPRLAVFECFDGSHLRSEDAEKFTEILFEVMQERQLL